jgi:2-polyprenyl-3-methyl-5-hydroxy-6-metoxy-1,4-benzoquinol methylase
MIINFKKFESESFYLNRATRSKFAVREFGQFFGKTILDVGSSNKELKSAIESQKIKIENYTSVDLAAADFEIDLDKESLPFETNSFETVVCTDVLEHLENIHSVFLKILSIASKNVIVSLPNCWFSLKKELFLGNESGKFFGLPPIQPQDRHRWFFNFTEARYFLIKNCHDKARMIEFYPYFNQTNRILKKLLKYTLSDDRYLNLFSPAIWAYISL